MKRNLSRMQRDVSQFLQSAKDVTSSYLAETSFKRDVAEYELEISFVSEDIDSDTVRFYPALRTHHPECLCPSCFQDDYEQDDTFTVYDHLGSPVIVDGLSSVIWNKEGYVRVQTGYCAVKFVDSERRWYLSYDHEVSQDTIEAVAYANSRKR